MSTTVLKRLMVISVSFGTSRETAVSSVVVFVVVLLVSTLKEDVLVISVEKVDSTREPNSFASTDVDEPTFTSKDDPVPIVKVDEVDIAV